MTQDLPTKISNLSQIELKAILPYVRRKKTKQHEFVFLQGDPSPSFYILDRGRVRIFYSSWHGREVTFCHCGPGDLFGLAEAISQAPRSASAEAIEDVIAWALPSDALSLIANDSPEFMMRVAEAMSTRLHAVAAVMEAAVTMPLRLRLLEFLIHTAKSQGPGSDSRHICEGMTQQTIADILGCARQTVARLLNDLARDNLIQIRRKRIILKDISALLKYLEAQPPRC